VRLGARVLYRRADIERYIEAHVHGHGTGENCNAIGGGQ
jgi:hypothetical protein